MERKSKEMLEWLSCSGSISHVMWNNVEAVQYFQVKMSDG